MQLRITLIIAMVAIAALAIGCGGGSDSSSGGAADSGTSSSDTTSAANDGDGASTEASDDGGDSGPLTKAEFIKEGDEICQLIPNRYNELLGEIEKEREANKEPKLTNPEANVQAAVPPLPEAAREFDELTPPAGDEAKVEAMVEALEAAAEGLEAKPSSELSGPKSPLGEFQKLAKKYGLNGCATL